ncbi:MAG: hypothetical protein NC926_08355 [Candidatus Omnitrophica bacterium]|nr:hypothetical protein [Candidatus Omnitrophota bacterium]
MNKEIENLTLKEIKERLKEGKDKKLFAQILDYLLDYNPVLKFQVKKLLNLLGIRLEENNWP